MIISDYYNWFYYIREYLLGFRAFTAAQSLSQAKPAWRPYLIAPCQGRLLRFATNLYVKPSRSAKRSGLIPSSYRVVGAYGLGMSQLVSSGQGSWNQTVYRYCWSVCYVVTDCYRVIQTVCYTLRAFRWRKQQRQAVNASPSSCVVDHSVKKRKMTVARA